MTKKTHISKENAINHFLSNLLTILSSKVEDSNIEDNHKQSIKNTLNIISIIVSNKSILLGEKPDFFIQKISTDTIIKDACFIHTDKINKRKIKITMPDSDLILQTDKHYFSEAVKYLLETIIDDISFAYFSINKDEISIKHDAKNILTHYQDYKDASFIDSLNSKNSDHKAIYYNLAIAILEMLGMKIELSKSTSSTHQLAFSIKTNHNQE